MSPSSKVVFQSEGLWCYQAPDSEKDIYSSFPAVSAIAAVNEGKCGSYFVQCRAQHLILKRGAALWSMDKVNYRKKKKKKGLNISTLYTRKLQFLKCNSRLRLLEVPSPQGCTLWPGCSSPAVPVKAEGLLSVFSVLINANGGILFRSSVCRAARWGFSSAQGTWERTTLASQTKQVIKTLWARTVSPCGG